MSRFHDAMKRREQVDGSSEREEPDRSDRRATLLPLPGPAQTEQETRPRPEAQGTVELEGPSSNDPVVLHSVEGEDEGREHWPTADAQSALHPAYERMVQRLLGYRRAKRQNVVLVASAVAGEGASTVARNLACAIGGSGQSERTVLVDANLRTPRQHEALGIPRMEGLTDVVTGVAELTGAIRTGFDTELSLLTSGSRCDSPPHVLSSSEFHGIVAALQSEFDWVIVDGPPVNAYPDAAAIAAACGAAVLVLRAESTRWEVADEAKRVLESAGAEVLGAVLNRRKYHIPWFIYRRL